MSLSPRDALMPDAEMNKLEMQQAGLQRDQDIYNDIIESMQRSPAYQTVQCFGEQNMTELRGGARQLKPEFEQTLHGPEVSFDELLEQLKAGDVDEQNSEKEHWEI